MKKVVSIFSLFFVLASCDKNNEIISSENLIQKSVGDQTNLEILESKIGKIEKVQKIFLDEKTGSSLTLVFGGKNMDIINNFLKENKMEFNGLTKSEADALKNRKSVNKVKLSQSSNSGNVNKVNSFTDNDVSYDLVSKKLGLNIVGYSFSLYPSKKNIDSNKNGKVSVSWFQQTSLEWCEELYIYCENNYYPYQALHKTAGVYAQQRGWFWNGSGAVIGNIRDDGGVWPLWIDGPKFTRVGGEGDFKDIVNRVTWYDYESNGQTTSY